jgi:pyruvate ferredoxin oxidoreductase gamma subunit
VFEATPEMGLRARSPRVPGALGSFDLPRLAAQFAAPTIDAPATSELRTTEGWRRRRPVIALERCTRCVLCFALCPEGAIRLDEQNRPEVDYDHCKGCLVCATECPPRAIDVVQEDGA